MTQHQQHSVIVIREENGLGLAGFIISLAGLVLTAGLLSPIGLIVSLAALGRQPRGFAWAGVILGLIGSCGILVVITFAGVAILAAMGIAAVALVLSNPQKIEITADMVNTAIAVKAYEQEQGFLPADLELLGLDPTTLVDPWGNRYVYQFIDVGSFDLVSLGRDGQLGTLDDIHLSTLGEAWDAGDGGFSVTVEEGVDGDTVRLNLGEHAVTATDGDDGGRVTIDFGDRQLEIVGEADDEQEPDVIDEDAGGEHDGHDAVDGHDGHDGLDEHDEHDEHDDTASAGGV